jgi:hypothetical protein
VRVREIRVRERDEVHVVLGNETFEVGLLVNGYAVRVPISGKLARIDAPFDAPDLLKS